MKEVIALGIIGAVLIYHAFQIDFINAKLRDLEPFRQEAVQLEQQERELLARIQK